MCERLCQTPPPTSSPRCSHRPCRRRLGGVGVGKAAGRSAWASSSRFPSLPPFRLQSLEIEYLFNCCNPPPPLLPNPRLLALALRVPLPPFLRPSPTPKIPKAAPVSTLSPSPSPAYSPPPPDCMPLLLSLLLPQTSSLLPSLFSAPPPHPLPPSNSPPLAPPSAAN